MPEHPLDILTLEPVRQTEQFLQGDAVLHVSVDAYYAYLEEQGETGEQIAIMYACLEGLARSPYIGAQRTLETITPEHPTIMIFDKGSCSVSEVGNILPKLYEYKMENSDKRVIYALFHYSMVNDVHAFLITSLAYIASNGNICGKLTMADVVRGNLLPLEVEMHVINCDTYSLLAEDRS